MFSYAPKWKEHATLFYNHPILAGEYFVTIDFIEVKCVEVSIRHGFHQLRYISMDFRLHSWDGFSYTSRHSIHSSKKSFWRKLIFCVLWGRWCCIRCPFYWHCIVLYTHQICIFRLPFDAISQGKEAWHNIFLSLTVRSLHVKKKWSNKNRRNPLSKWQEDWTLSFLRHTSDIWCING